MKGFEEAPKLPPEFTGPALVGLVVLAGTVLLLLVISNLKNLKKAVGSKGSQYVIDDSEGTVVRRSLRSVKKPERWEPPLIGQGADSLRSPLATAEKVASKATRAAKQAAEKVKEEIQSVVPEVTPPNKTRGRPRKSDGARPKSPKASRPTTSPSPPRTRRVKTPRS